jgi:hypothetical protein
MQKRVITVNININLFSEATRINCSSFNNNNSTSSKTDSPQRDPEVASSIQDFQDLCHGNMRLIHNNFSNNSNSKKKQQQQEITKASLTRT